MCNLFLRSSGHAVNHHSDCPRQASWNSHLYRADQWHLTQTHGASEAAGKSETKSGVQVKRTEIKSSFVNSFEASMVVINSTTASRMRWASSESI